MIRCPKFIAFMSLAASVAISACGEVTDSSIPNETPSYPYYDEGNITCATALDCAADQQCVMVSKYSATCQPLNPNTNQPRVSKGGRPMPPVGLLTGDLWRAEAP